MTRDGTPGLATETLEATELDDGTVDHADVGGGLVRGATVGRYVVLEMLGAGGMGIVYAAFDPELDRKVALKLLRGDRQGRNASAGRTRLQREAQAMARLQHPNVIAVHDVGTFGDQVFVAMEFVEGRTLGSWLGEVSGWRQVLDPFMKAGRGLEAAHAAALVHRDFKPDNVLVGDDGRVRVMDFGLARPATDPGFAQGEAVTTEDSGVRPGSVEGISESVDALGTPLTRTGAVLGTPAYMAPEQHVGRPADARADQFSFCVALYEGLYGERPFGGDTMASLSFNVLQGKVRAAPSGSQVPGWVRRVLLRGLAVEPEERWPGMTELLAALEADPARKRRRWLVTAAGVALVAGGVAGGAQIQRTGGDLCGGAADRLIGVWDDDVRARLAAGFADSGVAYAGDAWSRAEPIISSWVERWSVGHREACEATQVRREQSAALMDARMACLDGRFRELRALTTVLADADADVVENAVAAAHDLPAVGPCSDPVYVQAAVKPPDDPATARAVDAARDELARAAALREAGKYVAGLEAVDAVMKAVDAAGYPPLEAEARVARGELLSKAGRYDEAVETLEDGFFRADALGLPEMAQEAALELTYVVGYRLNRFEDGLRWGRHARAKVERRGDEPGRADLENNLGTVYTGQEKFEKAREHYERALELREKVLPPGHPSLGWTLNNLGAAHWGLRDAEQAEIFHRRALELREETLGPEHPDVAASLNNLAVVFNGREDYARGRAHHERALAIREKSLGPDHVDTVASQNNLGSMLVQMGEDAAAVPHLEAAARRFEKLLGPDHPYVIVALGNLGQAYLSLGRAADAARVFQRVLRDAVAREVDLPGDAADARLNLARALLANGQPDQALPLARAAEAGMLEHEADADALVEARVVLARALWETGKGGPARALALRARAEAEAAQVTDTLPYEQLTTWLRDH